MKTLTDFKNRLIPGTKLIWEFLAPPIFKDAPTKEERIVHIKQTLSVGFTKPDGRISYLDYPKAKNCKFEENKITIYDDPEQTKPRMSYTFI